MRGSSVNKEGITEASTKLGRGKASELRVVLGKKERGNHTHILGSTGTGKSKLLEYMLRQDILDRNAGLCLLDPHGTLYDEIMLFASHRYPHLADRIVTFHPARDTDYIAGFNPVSTDPSRMDYFLENLISACLKAWGQSNSDTSPRIGRWLENIFHAIMASGMTLLETVPLTSTAQQDGKRERLLQYVMSEAIQSDWASYARATLTQRQMMMEGASNRLRKFLRNETIRLMIGQQKHVLDFHRIMQEGKILLVNLNGEDRIDRQNMQLIGTLMVNEIFSAAQLRDPRDKTLKPFYFYIDEFAQFITRDIAYSLEEARKRKLFMILAHQHLAQLKKEDEYLYASVMTNCKNKIVFGGLSVEDSDVMNRELQTGFLDLKSLKHEQYRTRVRHIEETREVRSRSASTSNGVSESVSNATTDTFATNRSETEGEAQGHTIGRSQSFTIGEARNYSISGSQSSGETRGESESSGQSQGLGRQISESWSEGRSKGQGESSTEQQGTSSGTSRTQSASENSNWSKGSSETRSSSDTRGRSSQQSESQNDGRSFSHSEGRGTTFQGERMSWSQSQGDSSSSSYGSSRGTSRGESSSHTDGVSASNTQSVGGGTSRGESQGESETRSRSESVSRSSQTGSSLSHGLTAGQSLTAQESKTQGLSRSYSETQSKGWAEGWSKNISLSEGESESSSRTVNRSETKGESESHGETRGTSSGTTKTQSQGESISIVPFLRPEEIEELASVSFWTKEELLFMKQGELKNQDTAHAVVKLGAGAPVACKVDFVDTITFDPKSTPRKLERFRARMIAAHPEYYQSVDDARRECFNRQVQFFGEPIRFDERPMPPDAAQDKRDGDGIFE